MSKVIPTIVLITIIAAIAHVAAKCIRKGRRLPTLVRALLGAGCGAAAGFLWIQSLFPGISLLSLESALGLVPGMAGGGIVGATLAALIFRQPVRSLLPSPGGILRYWTCDAGASGLGRQAGDLQFLTVLLEHAVYSAKSEMGEAGPMALDKLHRGEDPDLPGARLIWLGGLDCLELTKPTATKISVVSIRNMRKKRRYMHFASLQDRDGFISALEERFGAPFVREERPMSLGRATLVPLLTLVVLVALVGLLAAFVYRQENSWPQKGLKEDPFVGTRSVLFIGAAAVLGILGWLFLRIRFRPRLYVLACSSSSSK